MILIIILIIVALAIIGYIFKAGGVILDLIKKGIGFFFQGIGRIILIVIIGGLIVVMCNSL